MVLLFRLVALNVTIVELPGHPDQVPGVILGLVLAAFASFLPLRYWDKWGPTISRRPIFLGLDMVLNLTIYAYLGPASPFLLYTLGTPLLAGVLFRTTGAVLLGGGMFVGYYALVALSGSGLQELRAPGDRDIQALVVLPALYPLAAAAGAAVRSLLDRQAATQAALALAEGRAATGAERARVAREMHDSLGKTLYGIALAARGAVAPREQGGARRGRRRQRAVLRGAGRGRGGARARVRPALGHARPAARRRAGPLRARVVGPLRRRGPPARRRRRPAAPGHPLRALLHRPRGAGERAAPRSRDRRSTSSCATRRPTSSCRSPTTASASAGAATRGSCRPTATTGCWAWPSAASGSARRSRSTASAGTGTTVTVRLPSGDVRAAEPWALEGATE